MNHDDKASRVEDEEAEEEQAEDAAELLALPPVVRSVRIEMPAGSDPRGFAELITAAGGIRQGGRLSRREVRRAIERLYATERLADVLVFQEEAGPDAINLVFELTPITWVGRVEFTGNEGLTSEQLRKATGLELEQQRLPYFPERIEQLVVKLKQAYAKVGYGSVEITYALQPDAAGVNVLTFTLKEGQATRVLAVTAAGDPGLPIADILDTFGLRPGSVLQADRLSEGVKALRARYVADRFYRARVQAPVVTYVLNGAVVALPISAGPRLRFEFKGNRTFGADELAETLRYDGEETLDSQVLAQLAERIRRFYRLQGFADVRVATSEVRSADRKESRIEFHVDEGEPVQVVEVRFEGNQHFSDFYLRARLDESLASAATEAPLIGRVSEGEVSELAVAGHEAARAALRYTVDPTRVYVEDVYAEAIGRMVELYRADGYLSAFIDPPEVERVRHDAVSRALDVKLSDTQTYGRTVKELTDSARDGTRREARVVIRVREGVQTIIRSVEFPGAPKPEALASVASVKPGKPLNGYDVEASRLSVRQALGKDGYLYAKVNDEESFSEDKTSVLVRFPVEPGPQVKVGRILVQGLTRTREDVVRSALAVEENRLLDPEQLAQSQRNLARLGIFRNTTIRLNAPDTPEEVKDVYVTVEEKNAANLVIGGGASLIDGPRAFVQYDRGNIFGSGLQLQARAKVNLFNWSYTVLSGNSPPERGLDALGRRVNVGLHYPRVLALLPQEVGTRIDLVHERLNRPAYGFTRGAAITGVDWVAQRYFSASLQYEIEGDDIQRRQTERALSRSDIERLRFDEGTIYLHSIWPFVSADFRDDPANPKKGVWLSGATELVQSLGGKLQPTGEEPNSLFLKTSGQFVGYVPLPAGLVVSLSLRGGKVFPLDPNSRTIPPKRFFMGGASTMRGFRDDVMVPEDRRQVLRDEVKQCQATLDKTGCTAAAASVLRGEQVVSEGGELFEAARTELRFPLSQSLEGALFMDAGNLWLDQSRYDPLKLRYASGAGIRVVTPVGPAAFDLGINLEPDATLNESTFVGHFSIGLF